MCDLNVQSMTIFGGSVQTRVFVSVHELVRTNIRAVRRAFGLASSVGLAQYPAGAREKVARA
jgi:hypothetical protein